MLIRTKSIYKPKEESDGIRILVTRFYPRGVKKDHFDQWVRDLAPSASLLKSYKLGDVNWKEFTLSLLSELRGNAASLDIIYKLHGQSDNVTLLCYEKDGAPCHRHILRKVIQEPDRLGSYFVSENTDNHERCTVQGHVAYKEACMVP